MLNKLHQLVWRSMVWVSKKKREVAKKIEELEHEELENEE